MCIPEAQTTVGAVISAVDSVLRQPLFYSVQAVFCFPFILGAMEHLTFPNIFVCTIYIDSLYFENA